MWSTSRRSDRSSLFRSPLALGGVGSAERARPRGVHRHKIQKVNESFWVRFLSHSAEASAGHLRT